MSFRHARRLFFFFFGTADTDQMSKDRKKIFHWDETPLVLGRPSLCNVAAGPQTTADVNDSIKTPMIRSYSGGDGDGKHLLQLQERVQ